MKCKKVTFYDLETSYVSPKIILCKILSEDAQFLTFLSGRGRTYRVAKDHIISIEDSYQEFRLENEEAK